MKELGFLFVIQFMSLEPSKITMQNGEEWGTFHRQFLIPQIPYQEKRPLFFLFIFTNYYRTNWITFYK